MAGAPTPSAGASPLAAQQVCYPVGQIEQCVPLPIPPFVPAPQPNNVLTIPVQNQAQTGGCDREGHTAAFFLQTAITDFINGAQNYFGCGMPLRMTAGDCFAEIFGCPRYHGDLACYSGAWAENVYGPPDPLTGRLPGSAVPRYDSDPNFDQKVLDGTLDCSAPLILTNPPPPPLPPPPPAVACHDGSTPTPAPCGPGQCLEGSIGCCPCDPPLPYGPAGPLVDGSDNSTESYWTGAPAPLGVPTPELLEDDPGARIAPDVQPIGAPLAIPLPTASIAVTACNSCAGDSTEIDELDG
jgi:hypothetical protein